MNDAGKGKKFKLKHTYINYKGVLRIDLKGSNNPQKTLITSLNKHHTTTDKRSCVTS